MNLAEQFDLALDAAQVSRGALLAYDEFRGTLTLVLARGLSARAAERLRRIGPQQDRGWDMPLRALLRRRVYLFEKAAENRLIPQLLPADETEPVNSIALIPLQSGARPAGVLVLVTTGQHALRNVDLFNLREYRRSLAETLIGQPAARAEEPVVERELRPRPARPRRPEPQRS